MGRLSPERYTMIQGEEALDPVNELKPVRELR